MNKLWTLPNIFVSIKTNFVYIYFSLIPGNILALKPVCIFKNLRTEFSITMKKELKKKHEVIQ